MMTFRFSGVIVPLDTRHQCSPLGHGSTLLTDRLPQFDLERLGSTIVFDTSKRRGKPLYVLEEKQGNVPK
jgi:hypothetical protein